jgi:type VI protein secretion system component Hcp
MAFDGFIRIDGIEGESSDATHRGWIEIMDYDLGLSQKASGTASSAGGAGSTNWRGDPSSGWRSTEVSWAGTASIR